MKIHVCGQAEAIRALEDPTAYGWVVSIQCEDSTPVYGLENVPEERKLQLTFDDIEYDKHFAGYVGIDFFQAHRIIKFLTKIVADPAPVLIHCAAGKSRSTAVALLLLYMVEGDPNKALDRLLGDVQQDTIKAGLRDPSWKMMPNRRIVAFGEEILVRDSDREDGLLLAALQQRIRYGYHPEYTKS